VTTGNLGLETGPIRTASSANRRGLRVGVSGTPGSVDISGGQRQGARSLARRIGALVSKAEISGGESLLDFLYPKIWERTARDRLRCRGDRSGKRVIDTDECDRRLLPAYAEVVRALAVFMFMTRSNSVGCWTGRSAGFSPGFSPLRTRPRTLECDLHAHSEYIIYRSRVIRHQWGRLLIHDSM
jgi:hypothetical protein